MAVKFMTTKGSSTLSSTPYYVGVPQHERTMSKRESYAFLAEKTGYRATAIQATFLALKRYIRENAARGCISSLDGVASFRNTCRGSFTTMTGPWVKGKNYLIVGAVELDPFKSTLSGITPVNETEGANPSISSVLDTVTGVYDIITGTDAFTVAGTDLGPDTDNSDEYVALVSAAGVETKCTVSESTLGSVTAALPSAIAAGEYTLCVYTRSGLGSEFGVKKATRKVSVA